MTNKANGRQEHSVAAEQVPSDPVPVSRDLRKPVKAAIVQHLGGQAGPLLEQVLDTAGFWQHLEQKRRQSGRRRDQFHIIIKPDIDVFDPLVPSGTDPILVEYLVDLLHDRGFRQVAIGDGRNCADGWLHNRDSLVVPDLIGYRFETARKRPYDLVDLQGDLAVPPATEAGSCNRFSAHWVGAGYRINFAKNKTHEEYAFALCVHNLIGVVAQRGEDRQRQLRSAPDDCLDLLRRAPPDFNIIDGFVSCHGAAGQRAPSRMETHTFIASSDALLADWIGAAKMGLDPHASPVNDAPLKQIGLPARYRIDGDLAPYPLWRNVHPLLSHTARLRHQTDDLGRITEPWFQTVNRELFPFKDFYNDRINSFLAPLMAQLDKNSRSFGMVILLNYAIAKLGAVIRAQYTLFSKGKLRRRVAPLEIDLASYDRSAYESIPGYLAPYEQILAGAPANRMGLRWRLVDGSVLFSCAHTFPIPFQNFVRKVDITRSIQYMNDYIGGSAVAVRRDNRGRVTHQAERNLYLQQPNWMVLFGGDLIDVEKLEFIDYRPDRQTIYWRTVGSPNASASYDDGSVAFLRDGTDQTTVKIFARQQFSLPLFFHAFDVNLLPGIRDPIIENGYATFFAGTVANLRAKYEGHDFRIGQDDGVAEISGDVRLRDLARYLATAATALGELLRHREDVVNFGKWLFPTDSGGPSSTAFKELDRHGFRHFGPTASGTDYLEGRGDEQAAIAGLAALMRDAPDFVIGLVDAMRDDLNRVATSDGNGAGL